MFYKFYGGVHPSAFKTLTQDRPIKKAFIPDKVVIPLSQHTGSPAEAAVAVGDIVKVGQPIGKAAGFISSPVHASIGGKVTSIGYSPTPTLARSLAITVESQGGDQSFIAARRDADALSKEDLIGIIRDSGIVGLGGAAFPTHVKLSPPKNKTIDTVIINGAECEPYLTSDHHLMLEKSKEILKGLDIIAKILGVKNKYIAIEDNKLSAIYAMERTLRDTQYAIHNTKIAALRTKYPQGAEKQVIKAVLNREVPAGGLPMDVGCIVQNAGTALAIYEAVYLSKPLIERAVTLTGECLKEPMNISVRIGTLLKDLAAAAGGFVKKPAKVIMGGPMMGVAQYTLDVPATKGVSGIVFLPKSGIDESEESVCIRCGKCVEVCPMGLVPTTLMNLVKLNRFAEAKDKAVMSCYECGACAYECPAKIPLVDYMKLGKAKA